MAAPKLRLVFVFGAFLGILRAPCRCVSLFWRGPLWEPFSWALSCFLALRPSSVAVPKLCQRLFLTGFRRPVFGPRPAPFLVRFWSFCARRAVPKLCQRLFLTGFRRPVFGPRRAPFLVRFWPFCARRAAAFPCFGRSFGNRFWQFGAGQGCAKAVPKAFSYRIQTSRFRSADGFVFGAFLGRFARAVPLRFPVLGVSALAARFGTVFGPGASKAVLRQSCAKAFFLPDSDAPFSVRSRPRFWCVFGHFARAVPLRFPVLGDVLGVLAVFWGCFLALRLCQSFAKGFFLPDSDAPFSVRSRPSFLVRFWASCARRAAAFPCFGPCSL